MGATWSKSSFSGTEHTCVEIAHCPDVTLIRDSKYTGPADNEPVAAIAPELWPAFLHLVLSATSGSATDAVSVTLLPSGIATITTATATLTYNAEEWDAFTKGITDGQFDRPRHP